MAFLRSSSDAPPVLKLVALDVDDLLVLSAHLQDAVIRIGDIRYLAGERRFVIAVNRYVWERTVGPGRRASRSALDERRRAVLHFDKVRAAHAKGLSQGRLDESVVLLAIAFELGKEPPAGVLHFTFSGGGLLRLEVECIEGQLTDLGAAWQAESRPAHERESVEKSGP